MPKENKKMKQTITKPCSKETHLGDCVWEYNPITKKYMCSICGEETKQFYTSCCKADIIWNRTTNEDCCSKCGKKLQENEIKEQGRDASPISFQSLTVGYHEENSAYEEFTKKEIGFDNVQYAVDKLERHFKLRPMTAIHRRNSGWGSGGATAYPNGTIVFRSKDYKIEWLTIAHEVNHFLCWKIQSKKQIDKIRHGTKKWNRQLQKILRYIKNRNFWEQEMKDREQRQTEKQLKEIEDRKKHREEEKIKLAFQGLTKTKPTKEDKKKQKIAKIEQRIKCYQRKIKLNQTLLKKANKKLKRLLN
jgi:hypothetical protein